MNDTIQKGFTLIELLIVIAIIGVLTTIGVINFVGVRERARDAERKADLSQIQTALEFYRSDNGRYPSNNDYKSIGCNQQFTTTVAYLKQLPCDPLTGAKYTYQSSSNFSYTLTACLENEEDTNRGTATGQSPECQGGISYRVENP